MFVWDGKMATQLAKDGDIHVITGLLKLYLRELPESLFTDTLYPNLVTGMGMGCSVVSVLHGMAVLLLKQWKTHLPQLMQWVEEMSFSE